ncbi:hypothetical protein GCM10023087_23780 [Microbacterium rhizosphaerae]
MTLFQPSPFHDSRLAVFSPYLRAIALTVSPCFTVQVAGTAAAAARAVVTGWAASRTATSV